MPWTANRDATAAATIALVTASLLAHSGATTAAAADNSDTAPRRISWFDVAPDKADAQFVLAAPKRKTAGAKSRVGAAPNYVGAPVEAEQPAKATTTTIEKKTAVRTPDEADQPAQNTTTVEKKVAARKPAKSDSADDLFRPDPTYDGNYEAQHQEDVYGAKRAVEPPRPLLELGRQQYTSGAYDASSTLLGEKNPLLPGLSIYGDWRTAVAYNGNNGKDIAQVATRLNLDVDFKITGTERIHAFFAPIQKANNEFTRYEFGGGDGNDRFNDELDANPQTLFFEGDFGSLYTGFSGQEASFDLPFTVGLFPLFLQNGIWANDAILGGAFTLPAKNSSALGLPNYDITFFAAFDDVDNAGLVNKANDNDNAEVYGVTTFIDAFSGYIEAGYGFVRGRDDREGLQTHFMTASYSRRYYNTVSNSTRLFANVGEDPEGNNDGFAIISENSLITGLPSTLLPYANFFVGFGNPQPLVDGNGAGILKNVGINFETDALTGYPKLDDTGSDAFGGAIGLQYLFNLDQQLVFELATVQPFDEDGIGAQDPQYGFGVRYQIALNRAWLFRADATYQIIEGEDKDDNFGLRAEFRRKF